MEKGIVRWFSIEKGYGFIDYNETEDIFVHFTGIDSTVSKSLSKGQQVSFSIANGKRGPQATKVTVQK